MNSTPRYFLEPAAWQKDTLTLRGDEAHHCARVLRSKVGDRAEIFDGNGRSATGTLREVSKDRVCIKLDSPAVLSPKLPSIHLLQAIPKGSNMELIIQKTAELGVASIQPLITEHTIARSEQLAKKLAKWQRIALEACKQCGLNYLPAIHPILAFQDWATSYTAHASRTAHTPLIAALHPDSKTLGKGILSATNDTFVLIGPEGDFSEAEYQQAFELGFQPISLGNIVLRVETATLYCMSVLRHELAARL